MSTTAKPKISPPDQFQARCAFCWDQEATMKLRSSGGWNVGSCMDCYDRHKTEPALRVLPLTCISVIEEVKSNV